MPALAQDSQIFARRRMIPHIGVHRGREHHASGEGEIRGGEKIVRQAVREFRQQIGSGGRDHQNIVLLRDADVFDGARKRVFGAGGAENRLVMHFAAGERGEGQRADEFFRGARS